MRAAGRLEAPGGPGYAPVLPALARVAEDCPSEERCAFVVEDARGALSVVPVANVAGEGLSPADAARARREAFVADPRAHLRLQRDLRRAGGRIVALFHSHVEGPARLSASDREGAAVDGAPALPGADLLVGALRRGKLREIGIFRWDGAAWREAGRLPSTRRAKSRPT